MAREPLAGREAYRHWATVQTRWSDNDAYGHVNNTIHYQWFDTVVNAWLIEAGLLDLGDGGERSGPIGLVVETGCRYALPLAYPQAVEIGVCVVRLGTSSVTYQLGVFAQRSAQAAAQGHFTHAYVDRTSRRPVPVPDAWRRQLAKLTGSGR